MPETLDIVFTAVPSSQVLHPKVHNTNAASSANGISFLTLFDVSLIGEKSAVAPRIIRVLKIFEPNTFPTAMSAFPLIADAKLTTISGVDVPIPTMVIPIMKSERPALFAMALAPSTR